MVAGAPPGAYCSLREEGARRRVHQGSRLGPIAERKFRAAH